jgi:hypothetical protein
MTAADDYIGRELRAIEVDAMVADSAVSAEGKLYLQGAGWNVITVQSLPAHHARVGLGILIHVPWAATNQNHSFAVRVLDSDNNEIPLGEAPPEIPTEDGKIRRFGGGFNIGRPPMVLPGDEQVIPLAINLDGLLFEKADTYRFVISVDGQDMKALRVRVMPVPFTGVIPG